MYRKVLLLVGLGCSLLPAAAQCCIPEVDSKFSVLDTTPTWGYASPLVTPDQWGSVAAACNGNRQSPIDLPAPPAQRAGPGALRPEWMRTYATNTTYTPSLTFTKNWQTYTVDVNPLQMLLASSAIDGVYGLLQFHYHAASEHTFNGKQYPLELHFVHQRKGASGLDGLLVLGFVYDYSPSDAPDLLLGNLVSNLPSTLGSSNPVTTPVPLASYIQDNSFWTYPGSLTGPPCSETVSWFVATRPILASRAQINAFVGALGQTNRPVQPLNGRQPQLITPVSQIPVCASQRPDSDYDGGFQPGRYANSIVFNNNNNQY